MNKQEHQSLPDVKLFRNLLIVILLLTAFLSGCRSEPEINRTEAERTVGAIDSLIEREVELGHLPGAAVQVKKGDSIVHRASYGYALKYSYDLQPLEDPELLTVDHLFDLASLTKVTGTTFAVMLLVDQGIMRLDDPVQQYLPEFKGGEKGQVTIRHLLTHSAGLAQWVPTYYFAENSVERFRYIVNLPLKWKPGEERHYSDLGFMLLGDIIERIVEMPLERFLAEQLFKPLGLQHTVFNPVTKGFDRIAATSHGNPFEKQMVYDNDFGYRVDADPNSWNGWRQYTLHGEVNDGNAWYANSGIAGHAGLFSTISDLQVLVDLLLNGGRFENKQVISKAVIDTFLTRGRYRNALGWAKDPDFISAKGAPEGVFGHTGFTGTSIVVVPEQNLSVILLTNRQHAGRQENGYYFNLGPLRQAILDEVLED